MDKMKYKEIIDGVTAEEGIEAVIGPKAPWINCVTGEPMHNKDDNAVGVYIVKEKTK